MRARSVSLWLWGQNTQGNLGRKIVIMRRKEGELCPRLIEE